MLPDLCRSCNGERIKVCSECHGEGIVYCYDCISGSGHAHTSENKENEQ